ncbi:MAG: M36 family metallopeptidase [Cryomorphaceae bacterium]|nr:M36 family metallopeptidase [Cryomorphaceae bacterium]
MKNTFLQGIIGFALCVLQGGAMFAQEMNKEEQFRNQVFQKLGISKDAIDIRISSQHQDAKTQTHFVYWQQFYQNKPIHNAVTSSVFSKNKKLKHLGNRIVLNPEKIALAQHDGSGYMQAFESAVQHTEWGESSMKIESQKMHGDTLKAIVSGGFETEHPVEIYPVYVFKDDKLFPAWNVSLPPTSTVDWWQIRLLDGDFTFLEKNNWTIICEHDHKGDHTHQDHAHLENDHHPENTPGYYVFRFPVESPSHGSQSMAVEPWDSLASPAGWHSISATIPVLYTNTRGNNVYAYEDQNASNSPGYAPDGGQDLSFIFPFDITKSVGPNMDINITQLFYANNKAHDLFYRFGFDEQSGNFQQNNFFRGGSQGDAVIAEAMDGGGQNNANFQSPPDGTRGRMQMYPWVQFQNTEFLQVLHPSAVAGSYNAVEAGFGPRAADSIITGQFIVMNDSSSNPTRGCVQTTQDLSGKIVLIDRGDCPFVEKITYAQNAGAAGVIMINNQTTNPFAMGGNPPGPINIPSLMISVQLGNTLKAFSNADSVVGQISDTTGSLLFDSSLDNGVVLHEYGHGVSVRLTGGRFNSGCLSNDEQAGEGWSDFFGLAFLTDTNMTAVDRRGIGTFLINQPTTGQGIRVQPYSTNFSQNSLTYNNIRTLSIPHGVGTVWSAMIWDMYWALVDKHGFNPNMYESSGGNNIAMQLVIDGLKYQPCGPGFVDSRDAILKADSIRYNGENQCLIWETFARRGLGYSADQGSPSSRSDGTQAFDIPAYCENVSTHDFDEDGVLPKVYPNPASGVFTIDFALWEGNIHLEMLSMEGRVVRNYNVNISPNSKMEVDVRNLPAGIYVVKLSDGKGKTHRQKLMLQ